MTTIVSFILVIGDGLNSCSFCVSADDRCECKTLKCVLIVDCLAKIHHHSGPIQLGNGLKNIL
jgi:hypothetical protein